MAVGHPRSVGGRPGFRRVPRSSGVECRSRHSEHAGDRQGHPGGRVRLPRTSVPDVGGLRRRVDIRPARASGADVEHPYRTFGRLHRRRSVLGTYRVCRDVLGSASQRPHRGRSTNQPSQGHGDRVPFRRGGGDVHGRARIVRSDGDLPRLQGRCSSGARRFRFRWSASRDVHACRGWDLHQGG